MDWVLSGAGLPAYHWGQVKLEAHDKFQENYSKANTPFCGVEPAGPGLKWAPTNIILPGKPTPRSIFCLLVSSQFSVHKPPFDGVDPAGPRFGVSPPTNKILPGKHNPEEQLLFAGPRKIINANTPTWCNGPCGPGVRVSPPKWWSNGFFKKPFLFED